MLCPIGQSNEKPPLQALAKWWEYVTRLQKKDLFNKILKEILNNRTRKYAVAGVWKSDKVDRAKVEIKGGKQIWMVEKQKH